MNRRRATNQPPGLRVLAAEVRRLTRELELLSFHGKLDQLFQRVSRLEEALARKD